ncbi:MAG TPA: zeta toxin family protein [Mycobacterium sp.]|nr:zeta toxin family protein [Mycobacterium sp.]
MTARLYVLAGVNGAGKSSIGGAMIRSAGGEYYNPDEAARRLMQVNPGLDQTAANAAAWQQGRRLLERAIVERLDFAFETTLGGGTMTRLIGAAAAAGFEVRMFYVGLASPELHLARVRERAAAGGHDISEDDIRRRWRHSRMNLIKLMPDLKELRAYDNSADGDPKAGDAPAPVLVLHLVDGDIVGPPDLGDTPLWARPVVAAALKRGS